MKKTKINITVVKEDIGYSANTTAEENFIATDGNTLDELKFNILEAVNLAFEG